MTKDPVQSLVDFAQDIKPYHTKIVEVLVDYIYSETMNVSVEDRADWLIDTEFDYHQAFCDNGFGVPEWGGPNIPVLDRTVDGQLLVDTNNDPTLSIMIVNITNTNVIHVVGKLPNDVVVEDLAYLFPAGTKFDVTSSFGNDGRWMSDGALYNSTTHTTQIIVSSIITDSLELPLFAAHAPFVCTDPDDCSTGAHRNLMYIGGRVIDFFAVGQSLTLHDTVHHHNGSWLINKIRTNGYFSEVTVQHLTDNDPSGELFINVTPDTQTDWPTGMYWYDTGDRVLKQWGGSWIIPTNVVYYTRFPPSVGVVGDLWFVENSASLYRNNGTAWVQLTTEQIVVGPTPDPIINQGDNYPNYVDTGPVIISPTPSFTITNVEVLHQSLIPNPEYVSHPDNSAVEISSSILNNQPAGIFHVSGIANVAPGVLVIIKGSRGNDGVWKVVSTTYNVASNTTLLTMTFDRLSTVDTDELGYLDDIILQWNQNNESALEEHCRYVFWDVEPFETVPFDFAVWTCGEQQEDPDGDNLNIPLTSGYVTVSTRSNFDTVLDCLKSSPTTAITKIKESHQIDVSIPLLSAPFDILDVSLGSAVCDITAWDVDPFDLPPWDKDVCEIPLGYFVVAGDQRRYFANRSQFVIDQSGSNDGLWTVDHSTYDPITNTTNVFVVELIPPVYYPLGNITEETAMFGDVIKAEILEGVNPPAWEYNYYSAPTSPILYTDTTTDEIAIKGDMRRFFTVGSKLTLDSGGAWNWTVLTIPTYNMISNTTTIRLLENITTNDNNYVSGQPTWFKGIGWGDGGWSTENDPWLTIVLHPIGGGDDWTVINNYDMFVTEQGAFDSHYSNLGGFDSILQQILPI